MTLVPGLEQLAPTLAVQRDRSWTGNDTSGRAHHGVIPLASSPLELSLSWRESAQHPSKLVGCFRLDLHRLLADGVIRSEDAKFVRVRFFHDLDGGVYLQTKRDAPRVLVGRA